MGGSAIFKDHILANAEADDLSLKVWSGTPWIASLFTDDDRRHRQMVEWMYEHFGPSAFPFGDNPVPGRWREGNATVFGWTWFGFSTEAEMGAALEAWPEPSRTPPDADLGPGRVNKSTPTLSGEGEP